MLSKKELHPFDSRLAIIVGVLLLIGLVMLASASAPKGYADFKGDSFYYVKHQIFFGLVPGLFFLYAASRVPYTFWKKHAWPILLGSVILLLAVFLPGVGSQFGTSHSWLAIPGLFSIQPGEIVKLTFIFYLAAWLEKRGSQALRDPQAGFIPFVSVLGIIVLLLILQPDVGTMSIIVAAAMVVYFIAGAPVSHVAGLILTGVILFGLLVAVAPYRAARFTTFLYPELDPQGIGYHINQALLAVGSGGWLGVGYGHSRQKFEYLPEVEGDSIFAVISEEMGFVLATGLIFLFLLLFRRVIKIAMAAPDLFGKYLAIGIVSWLVIQAFVNIGSMVCLVPMTGVTLPFISYGGTSLAISLAAVGVLLNISRYGNPNPANKRP